MSLLTPNIGDYAIQVVGVDSVEEFEKKSKKGQYPNNFERVAWWDNSLGSWSTKRNKSQPFWWFGAPKGSAFSPVLHCAR
eukprot:8270450-Karenia_brevis.AAC.1